MLLYLKVNCRYNHRNAILHSAFSLWYY